MMSRILILKSIPLDNFLPGLNVHEPPVDVPFTQYHQLDDAAILRALRHRRAPEGYGACVRLRNMKELPCLGLIR